MSPSDRTLAIRFLSLNYRVTYALLAVLLVAAAATMVLVLRSLNAERSEAVLIDVAGRQRKLNQEYLKRVLLTQAGFAADHEDSRLLFLDTLEALLDGGEAVVDRATGERALVRPAPTDSIRRLLESQRGTMARQEEAVRALLATSRQDGAYARRVSEATALNDELQRDLDRLLLLYGEASVAQATRGLLWATAAGGLGLVIGVILLLQTGRAIRLDRLYRQEERSRGRVSKELAAIVDFAADGIITINTLGGIRTVNPAAEELFGYRARDLIGRNIKMLMPERYRAAFDADLERYRRAGRSALLARGGEYLGSRKDGSTFPMDLSVGEMKLDDEVLFVGMVRDITERKRVQLALAESRERFDLAVRGSTDGLWDWNVLTNEVWFSPRFKEMFGYADEEFPNVFASWESTLHPDDHAPTMAAIAAHLERHEPYDVEYRCRIKSGEYRWFRARGQALWNEDGEPVRMAGSILDVTDARRAAAELTLAKERADEANLAKSRFLASMSHELRTPLNAVIGYSELLQEEAEDEGRRSWRDDLKKIETAGQQLLGLINDVLDLSKVEAGRMTLQADDIETANLCSELVETVRPLFDRKGNRLSVRHGDAPATFSADLTRVRQILLNLLSNANKFTERGEVLLETASERRDDGEWVVFRVVDTGIGMAPEVLERIFEPFAQADGSTTRKYGGTGLGLAISRQLTDAMGGTIEVESEPGRGTTFTVGLPASGPAPAAKPAAPAGAEAQEEAADAIVVIDDDPAVRDLLDRFLTREGFAVLAAENGRQGIELARAHRPLAITLDVLMPTFDGWSVLTEIKNDPQLAAIPVVLLTMVEDESLGFALGADEYLVKPIDRGRLLELLERYRAAPGRSRTVLVVDDDDETQELLGRSLAGAGWGVTRAADGRQALARLAERAPDVILLDLMMPEMDGFELIEAIRREPAWSSIPIVVLTARELAAEDRRHLSGEVQKVLQKGTLRRGELLAEVARQLRRASRLRQHGRV